MDFNETLEYLFSALPMFHRIGPAAYKANLDNTISLCELLNHPEKDLKCIHIAGTNGKGSVSHMLASIFQGAGFKTGLNTSPHLKDFRERIRVNGIMVSKEWVSDFVSQNKNAFEVIKPSFFEMSTAMAFEYFRQQETDIAFIETGLGGRLDSTNVITPYVSVITNISYDHMNLLGDSITKIAIEKAGIIKPGIPVVIGEVTSESLPVFNDKVQETNSKIFFASKHLKVIAKDYHPLNEYMVADVFKDDTLYIEDLVTDLTGLYQLKNIATVIQTLNVLTHQGINISPQEIRDGLKLVKKRTGLSGRWEILQKDPVTICDTGHNEDGLKEVLSLLEQVPHAKLHFVLGVVNDKDIEKMLAMFPKDAIYYFCKANIPRGLEAKLLAEKAKHAGLTGRIYETVKSALKAAQLNAGEKDIVFIGGSTFTVAEVV